VHLENTRAVLGCILVGVERLDVHVLLQLRWRLDMILDRVVLFCKHLALEGSLHVGPVAGVMLNQTLQVL
jgi:hypothetical protein